MAPLSKIIFSEYFSVNSRLPHFSNYANEEERKEHNDKPCHDPDCESNHVDLGGVVHIGEWVCWL